MLSAKRSARNVSLPARDLGWDSNRRGKRRRAPLKGRRLFVGVAVFAREGGGSFRCQGHILSPKIGDVLQRKKLSTTIDAKSYAYLHRMVKTGRAESFGEAVDKAVAVARRIQNRAALERATAEYFNGLDAPVAAEEGALEDALSAASAELDFDQP